MQQSFVQETILAMNPVSFDRLKAALLGEYIQFRIVTPQNVTKEILAEKLHATLRRSSIKQERNLRIY